LEFNASRYPKSGRRCWGKLKKQRRSMKPELAAPVIGLGLKNGEGIERFHQGTGPGMSRGEQKGGG